MKSDREILTGIVTVFALVAVIGTEFLSHATQHRQGTVIAGDRSDPKLAAFAAAKKELEMSMVYPEAARWAPASAAGFSQNGGENFLALQVDVKNGRGEVVREHWIVRLEAGTNRVLSRVCKEQAEAVAAGQ